MSTPQIGFPVRIIEGEEYFYIDLVRVDDHLWIQVYTNRDLIAARELTLDEIGVLHIQLGAAYRQQKQIVVGLESSDSKLLIVVNGIELQVPRVRGVL